MKLIAIIPARGGSKGIINKNIRLLNSLPLIYYPINNAKLTGMFDEIVVTSDNEEILYIASNYGISTLKRTRELSQDHVTLDPVVYDALIRSEQKNNTRYDIVVTLQPTSPLLISSTLKDAIMKFTEDKENDTYISVSNKPHLAWIVENGKYTPAYKERLVRQKLPPYYLETGSFMISKRENVTNYSRLGATISVFPVPETEAVDIDNMNDWLLCQSQLSKRKIVFRTDAHNKLGMGHVYRTITLYQAMLEHDLIVVLNKAYPLGVNAIKKAGLKYHVVENDEDFFKFLNEFKPDIAIIDCLNTEKNYILKLKKSVSRVVVLEDEGNGSKYADVAINAMHEGNALDSNRYYGAKYCCLRDEFIIKGSKPFSSTVNNIFVSFGGSDPSDITTKVYGIACALIEKYPDIRFDFVVGLGFREDRKFELIPISNRIKIVYDTSHISEYMAKSDMAIISNGGTAFEVCSLGVPSIVLSQNLREASHAFAQIHNGFINLGLGENIDTNTIYNTILWLMNTPIIRNEMRNRMLSTNLKNGTKTVKKIILGEIQ